MNLVCFPHYTCGGLLCDILNVSHSAIGAHGGIVSPHHNLGKMEDSDSVLTNYDVDQFMKQISGIDQFIKKFSVFSNYFYQGTHNWPGCLPLDKFDKIINVTTATHRSRLYRWLRAYHFYYSNNESWTKEQGQARIDKERETAKNYLVPFEPVLHACVINLEFSEVVEQQPSFTNLIADYASVKNIQDWRQHNSFLFDWPTWTTTAAARLHEAELEVNLNTAYVYQ
jgi:hypothetical protein